MPFIEHAARKLSLTCAFRQEMKRRSSVSVFVCLWQNAGVYGLKRSLPGRCTLHAPLGLGKPLAYSTSGLAGVGATSNAIPRRLREAIRIHVVEHVTGSKPLIRADSS